VLVGAALLRQAADVRPDARVVERSGHAQRPGKRPPPLGQVQAPPRWVDGGASARQPAAKVGNQHALDFHDAEQV